MPVIKSNVDYMANVFLQISFGTIAPTDAATRGLLIETLNTDSRIMMKEVGITVEDATFVYHAEKNVQENFCNGYLGGALFTVPEEKLPTLTNIERMEFQSQDGCFLVMFDMTKNDRDYLHKLFGKLFEAGEMGEPSS